MARAALICLLAALTVTIVSGELLSCQCELAFRTYTVQTVSVNQLPHISFDTDCQQMNSTCLKHCQDKSKAVITDGARTNLNFGRKRLTLGDHLCGVGRLPTPVVPATTDLTLHYTIWKCGIVNELIAVVDQNFCCDRKLRYFACK